MGGSVGYQQIDICYDPYRSVDEDPTYPGKRATTTIEVNAKVLSEFRKAVANRYDGRLHGFMYIEYCRALEKWTKVMKGEAKIVDVLKTPTFEASKDGNK